MGKRKTSKEQGELLAPEPKIVHRAKWLNANGDCRPLCRPKGPIIDYAKEQSAIEDSRVTCPRCRALLKKEVPGKPDNDVFPQSIAATVEGEEREQIVMVLFAVFFSEP